MEILEEEQPVISNDNILNLELEKGEQSNYSDKRKFFVEFLGSTILVFILELCLTYSMRNYFLIFQGSLILISMIFLFGKISGGHFNPAITLPMFLRKKVSGKECIYYIIAQLLGGFIGTFFVGFFIRFKYRKLYGHSFRDKETWDYLSTLICEILLSFIFAFTYFSSTLEENKKGNISCIIIGITYYLLCSNNSVVSHSFLNPISSLPSAIILAICGENYLPIKQIWLYILGPIIGGICAGFTFMIFD